MQFLFITEEHSNFFFKCFTEVILDDRILFLAIFLERMSDQHQRLNIAGLSPHSR